ncbi:MAG TPA: cystathionine gamma-synthase [Vicinamibacteria bacterium]|nr:cystathionine gamma-synthase [Vicinamibacteria bacterium]
MGFATDAIHAGQHPDPSTGAIITPIYQTSTYVQEALGKHKGYEYARTQNPTRSAVEANIAALERGRGALAFASGMAAISAVLTFVKQGDRVVVTEDLYGGTYRLFQRLLTRFGIRFTYVDSSRIEAVEKTMGDDVKLVFLETPTNPVLRITDLRAVSELAHRFGARVVVDNTFMSPFFQRPLELGADLVVHSTTKYLNGHSDSVGGMVVASRQEDIEHLAFVQNAVGAILSPFDSWLLLRGTKTLALRMERHNQNAVALAEFLSKHPKVQKLYYPGLPDHPGHQLAKKQMSGFGGMISFETGSLQAARKVLEGVTVFSLAESLGGVESLISHPATMTHASIPVEDRLRFGVTEGLVRLSVGVEDLEDLEADLRQALAEI